MGWGWGVFGGVHMALWWILIILVIVLLVKWLVGSPLSREPDGATRALDILKERYAKGEIGKDEFEEKRQIVTK